jgi:hypothetical protein
VKGTWSSYYINTVVWRGFNGGWKSVRVGLGSYQCIRWHHTPDSTSMSNYKDPHQIADIFEEDFAHRPDYIYKYRHCYGFHPMHGLMTTYPLKRLRHASNVIVAGAENPSDIQRALGFDTAETVGEAVAKAKECQAKDASIVFVKYPILACRQ